MNQTDIDISIIIPVFNEQRRINDTLAGLYKQEGIDRCEIIVVDGGPDGGTLDVIEQRRDNLIMCKFRPGRAVQMNTGAAQAKGNVLLFLHGDTQLPKGGLTAVKDAVCDGGVLAGAFGLKIDSSKWIFKVMSRVINVRCRMTRIPYGDQGQFFSRDFFHELGGYKEIELMEDVEIMRRLRMRKIPISLLPIQTLTSPRRWEIEGIVACTLRNWTIMTLYLLGVPPGRLAKWYRNSSKSRQKRSVIVLFARYPEAGKVKTRLAESIGAKAACELYSAFLVDSLAKAITLEGCDTAVCFSPLEKEREFKDILGHDIRFFSQKGNDIGQRMYNAFESVFSLGYERAILIGADLPDLPREFLAKALQELEDHSAVLGPAEDGGYYLVGFNAGVQSNEFFTDIEWSGPGVFEKTVEKFKKADVSYGVLDQWHDVDTLEDLRALHERITMKSQCPQTFTCLPKIFG